MKKICFFFQIFDIYFCLFILKNAKYKGDNVSYLNEKHTIFGEVAEGLKKKQIKKKKFDFYIFFKKISKKEWKLLIK